MKLVVTGVTGFIGKNLVPYLKNQGHELVLIGRSVENLKNSYPSGCCLATYEELNVVAEGADAIIHLAARNNDKAGSLYEYQKVNVDLLRFVADTASQIGVDVFVNVSSIKADKSSKDAYSATKAKGEELLQKYDSLNIVNLKLAATYGNVFKGQLSFLNGFPVWMHSFFLNFLKCLRPAVEIGKVCRKIGQLVESPPNKKFTEYIIADNQEENPFYKWGLRLIDLSIVFLVVILLWWLMVLIWIAVKLSSYGPGIFIQTRIGKNTKPFKCYKFRTMEQGTKQLATHEVSLNSITKVGHFLRATKLDELPQLANILFNQMSLVGPRPNLPNQIELIDERKKRGVYIAKPGITGLAQISNVDMSRPLEISKLDASYISKRTLIGDLKILIATITGSGQGDKVKKN